MAGLTPATDRDASMPNRRSTLELVDDVVRFPHRAARHIRDEWRTALATRPVTTRKWWTTSITQLLPEAKFGKAGAAIDAAEDAQRMYCAYRDDADVMAAVAYRMGAGPNGSVLIYEFAVAHHPGSPYPVVDLAWEAAAILVERLHSDAAAAHLNTELRAVDPRRENEPVLLALDFEHLGGTNGDDVYRRLDAVERSGWKQRAISMLDAQLAKWR